MAISDIVDRKQIEQQLRLQLAAIEAAANGIVDPSMISIGQELVIPQGGGVVTQVPAATPMPQPTTPANAVGQRG